jgi:mono/diheme cytochrome c family protein
MRRFAFVGGAVALLLAAAFWLLTMPERADPSTVLSGPADIENGRLVFYAGGCASCHATPNQPNELLLGGGLNLPSPYGTFVAPNISQDPDAGIGKWTEEQFVTAVTKGTSPDGQHLYPAFPYTTYASAKPKDLHDLFAFLKTLPASSDVPPGHEIPLDFPIVRRGVGLWKLFNYDHRAPMDDSGDPVARGRYLIESLGHCAECHSPRDWTGGVIDSRRFAGGPSPDGKGNVPNITPGKGGIGEWSDEDIAFSLEDGSTPDGDVLGGEMARVIKNTGRLPEDDRQAMAAYLKSLTPIDSN